MSAIIKMGEEWDYFILILHFECKINKKMLSAKLFYIIFGILVTSFNNSAGI